MIHIKLNIKELILFKKIFENDKHLDCLDIIGTDIKILEKDTIIIEYLIDKILDYFLTNGLDDVYDATDLGLEIEKLNEKFIRELQILNDSTKRI